MTMATSSSNKTMIIQLSSSHCLFALSLSTYQIHRFTVGWIPLGDEVLLRRTVFIALTICHIPHHTCWPLTRTTIDLALKSSRLMPVLRGTRYTRYIRITYYAASVAVCRGVAGQGGPDPPASATHGFYANPKRFLVGTGQGGYPLLVRFWITHFPTFMCLKPVWDS